MIISKRTTHKVSMGNFEMRDISVEVLVDTEKDFDTEPTDDEVLGYIDQIIDGALADDLAEIADLTASEDSYVHHIATNKITGKKDS